MNNIIQNKFPTLYKTSGINRCYVKNCYLIPLINIKQSKGKYFVDSKCRNGHYLKDIPIKEFLLKSQNVDLQNEFCTFCKCNEKKNHIKIYFCPECKKYVCKNNECEIKHYSNCKGTKKENLIDLIKFDDYCIKHGENLISFCNECQKSFCCDCTEHQKHKINSFMNIGLKLNDKKVLFNRISKAFFGLERIKTLFNKTIEDFKKQFDDYYEMNKSLLLLNQMFLDNYKKDKNGEIILNVKNNVKYIKENFYNHSFKNENILTKLKHFNELINQKIYLLREKKYINPKIEFKIENNIQTLEAHTGYIYHLLFLKDKRLSSCSSDKSVIIYNKENYTPDLKITIHKDTVYYHIQLRNENIVTCSYDKEIKIIQLLPENKFNVIQTLIGHNNSVLKVLETYDEKIISCSSDQTMKIWEKNEKNDSYYCIDSVLISEMDNNDTNILLINENEIVSSSVEDKLLKFWNLKKNFSLIKILNDIDCNYSRNSMYLLNDLYLLIGGFESNKGIYIIDIIRYQLIKNCVKNLNYVDSIIGLYNGTLLVGAYDNNKYSLINYKFEKLDFVKIKSKESAHKGEIFGLIATNNGIVISCSDDSTIKIWN